MDITDRPVAPLPWRRIAAFLAAFCLLYAGALLLAEATVGRGGDDSAFQRLLAQKGGQSDWVVLGASHALPLAYGDVPGRLMTESGQSMTVLAEVGAGPLYSLFLFRQAAQDITPRRLLYVVDSFAVTSARWNEERLTDRKLLRKTPLRLSTARIMAGLTIRHGGSATGLADYLTGFSKLNPPDRFPAAGWRGAADFDRKVRLSRHAVESRIGYLYPGTPDRAAEMRYLAVLTAMLDEAQARGIAITVVKLPLPEAFRAALPDEAAFDNALRAQLAPRGIAYHDLSAALSEPGLFFDTDHLNRAGVDALYTGYLRGILTGAP